MGSALPVIRLQFGRPNAPAPLGIEPEVRIFSLKDFAPELFRAKARAAWIMRNLAAAIANAADDANVFRTNSQLALGTRYHTDCVALEFEGILAKRQIVGERSGQNESIPETVSASLNCGP